MEHSFLKDVCVFIYNVLPIIGLLLIIYTIFNRIYVRFKYFDNIKKDEVFFEFKFDGLIRVKMINGKIIIEKMKLSFLMKEKKYNQNTINIKDIENIEYKKYNHITSGYLQFNLKNSKDKNNYKPVLNQFHDDNTIMWYSSNLNKNAEKIINYIENYKKKNKDFVNIVNIN